MNNLQRFYFFQQKLKPDEDPDVFFQHLNQLRERFEEIRGAIYDRRLTHSLIDKLVLEYQKSYNSKGPNTQSFGLHKALLAMRQM